MAQVTVTVPILHQLLTQAHRPVGFDIYFNPSKVLDDLKLPDPEPQQDVATAEEGFKVMLNVIHFAIYQIRIYIQERKINVDCSHGATVDAHGQINRTFTRQIDIPENIDPDLVTATLFKNGIMTLKAPLSPNSPTRGGRVVSLIMQEPINGSAAQQGSVSIPIERISTQSNNNNSSPEAMET